MSIRTELGDRLRTALGTGWTVIDHAREPDAVTGRTVVLWVESFEPHPDHATAVRADVVLWVLTGREDVAAADADLEPATEAVIGVLHNDPAVLWRRADRQQLGNYHAYKLTAECGGELGDTP